MVVHHGSPLTGRPPAQISHIDYIKNKFARELELYLGQRA